MWDNIPCEIQEEILKRLPIKSLLHFRFVSKAWKSLIESSAFIADYQHTELQQRILVRYDFKHKYVSIADDDTFPHQKVSLKVPVSVKLLKKPEIVGCSEGLFCLYDYFGTPSDRGTKTAVIWNPTIGNSVAVDVSDVLDRMRYITTVGFGVCLQTLDPMLLNISTEYIPEENNTFTDTTWRVEIFRLSSGAWRSLSINLPRRAVVIEKDYAQLIDRFIYWLAFDTFSRSSLIISFDMISEEFTEIRLPANLAPTLDLYSSDLYLHKFNGSLVVLKDIYDVDVPEYGVWMMENGDPKSFIKLYTIKDNKPDVTILSVFGYRKSGEPLVKVRTNEKEDYELSVYDPKSEHIDYTGISAKASSFFVSAYTETLLLLDH
ncbi:putative F-box domain-containing protein [Tanacetum coccineum]|uniref:F-box domain-containing protein n=1 Tax=Tanacetum coccineum TaxID=301880 RepID=A0ABQ5HIG7_9ASTR